MKIYILFVIFLSFSNYSFNTKITNNLKLEMKNNSKLTTNSKSHSKDNPKYMDNVLVSKAIPILSSEEKIKNDKLSKDDSSKMDTRFKEKEEGYETPQIIPNQHPRYDVMRTANAYNTQEIDNDKAFNLLYKNHESYYDSDKRMFVLDHHYIDTEQYLNKFSEAIAKGVATDKDLVHVSDLRAPAQIKADTNNPKFFPDAVRTTAKYGDLMNKEGLLYAATNPYKEIFNRS